MRNFKITTYHDVLIDDFNDGETDYVNGYTISYEVKAETPKEAIEKYYKEVLGFSFNFDYCEKGEENKNTIFYSNLVDDDNFEATEREKSLWEKGKKTLYANNTTCIVEEIVSVEI